MKTNLNKKYDMVSDVLEKFTKGDVYSSNILRDMDELYDRVEGVAEILITPTDLMLIDNVINNMNDFIIESMVSLFGFSGIEELTSSITQTSNYIEPEFFSKIIKMFTTELYFGYVSESIITEQLNFSTDNLTDFYLTTYFYSIMEEFDLLAYEDSVIDLLNLMDDKVKEYFSVIPDKIRNLLLELGNKLQPFVINNKRKEYSDFYMLFRIEELKAGSFMLICYGTIVSTQNVIPTP